MKEIINNKSFLTCEVYVGTYYKYNCGSLQGAWVDLTLFETHEEFMNFCKELHKDETDPEYMFQDTDLEYVFNNMISECGIDKEVFKAIEMYSDLQEYQKELLAAYMEGSGLRFFEAIENYEDNFITENIDAYMYECLEEQGITQFYLSYFDFDKFQRDIEMDLIKGICNDKEFYFTA